jgi:dihydrolipoamide dehydrogenase
VLDTAATWRLSEQPRRLAVAGAGASGVEVASAFARLGTEVTLLELQDRILPAEDEDCARLVARALQDQGAEIRTGVSLTAVEESASGLALTLSDGGLEVDRLCVAAGRSPDVASLALEQAGVDRDGRGLIAVDARMRTSRTTVWAIGDLVHGPALAHKASDEGLIAAEDAAGLEAKPLDYDFIPAVTFCAPQIARVGLTEAEARQRGREIVVGSVPTTSVGAPVVHGEGPGLVKLIGDAESGELLGGHVVSSNAAELIAEIKAARQFEAGLADIARSTHAHPTFSEAIQEAARAAEGWLVHG